MSRVENKQHEIIKTVRRNPQTPTVTLKRKYIKSLFAL